jgi:predicted DNA-binding protein
VSPRRRVSFFLDSHLEEGLKALKEAVGIPQAEAIRRAIAEYLERQGVGSKAGRKRADTRKHP